ncbi:putative TetR family transcriptional regulator [Gordonia hirsuta DSM 44140 = NBRC 16056]|uniref:Putative TetR family transcriptional regulator n=1 Tax=Gordonia hirsuta DSM 44140 = NBRC 16056 TaxID=1121927 RepID=L7L7Q2_9ACTN|nr:TetR/AcrR family transcriptional regulator [Gordonia hirsuta]GAC56786.1 putative TetR family transcriptional regulator [Gordonia hirsuta DSM 44140 = NBRC 16056]
MNQNSIREADPRRVRSRNRLLDAATALLSSGGVEAVTVDAVTRASRVAKTTLYRHFSSSTELVAAALERMLPEVTFPPLTHDVRADLITALEWLSQQLDEAPVKLSTVGWLAVSLDESKREGGSAMADLRDRLITAYRTPFETVFSSSEGLRDLGDVDHDLAFAQLAGPVLLSRLSGSEVIAVDEKGRRRIVDDFLLARRSRDRVD